MSNRRDFLRNVSFLTAGGLLAGNFGSIHASTVTSKKAATAKKIIGLQTYSLGNELFNDVPNGVKKLKQMGYTNLELAGYNNGKIGPVDMMEFKKMAEGAGLKITSSHVNPPVGAYSQSNINEIKEFWKKTVADHAKLGVKFLVQPGMPKCDSHADASLIGEVFNAAGTIAKEAGILFGYHNHSGEFRKISEDGKNEQIYDLFLKNTDPSLVCFEMDVYWTVMGQNDPVQYLKDHPDRIKLLHIKDRAVLGQSGMMNFEMIFKQAYANGIKDFFVELEGVKGMSQFDGVKGCAEYLLKAPFVK